MVVRGLGQAQNALYASAGVGPLFVFVLNAVTAFVLSV